MGSYSLLGKKLLLLTRRSAGRRIPLGENLGPSPGSHFLAGQVSARTDHTGGSAPETSLWTGGLLPRSSHLP